MDTSCRAFRAGLAALLLFLVPLAPGAALAAERVARAVLFYSPTCPHCHYVLEEVLPPLQARFGDQLEVQIIDVTQPEGQSLYRAAVTAFAIPEERMAVPTLVLGETVLVGGDEIPAQLPGLIEAAIAAGESAWPPIPGFEPPAAGQAAAAAPPVQSPFLRDPLANSLAVLLLLVMTISVIAVALTARPPFGRPLVTWRGWAVPLFAGVGLAIATYLSLIEVRGVAAACGPVGNCNAVQQSPYARLFGVLPVGVLGVIGYIGILGAWALHQYGTGPLARQAGLGLPALAFVGTLFSIYLTFLEPFVIGASCMWCLSSAALMTALLWLTAPRGRVAVRRGRPRQSAAH